MNMPQLQQTLRSTMRNALLSALHWLNTAFSLLGEQDVTQAYLPQQDHYVRQFSYGYESNTAFAHPDHAAQSQNSLANGNGMLPMFHAPRDGEAYIRLE
jgi:hypothetical protein